MSDLVQLNMQNSFTFLQTESGSTLFFAYIHKALPLSNQAIQRILSEDGIKE